MASDHGPPTAHPSVVFVESAVVGFAEVLQTIPLTVMAEPPFELIVPPLVAPICVTFVTALVETLGAVAPDDATVMAVHPPQLFPSFDSVIVPVLALFAMSAQART